MLHNLKTTGLICNYGLIITLLLASCKMSNQKSQDSGNTASSIVRVISGDTIQGQPVSYFTLKNKNGIEVKIMN